MTDGNPMPDYNPDDPGTWDDFAEWRHEQQREEEDRRVEAAVRQIMASYKVLQEIWGDREAHKATCLWLDSMKPKKKDKRRHNPDADDAFLRRYEAARLRGERTRMVREYATQCSVLPTAIKQRVKRMRREQAAVTAMLKEWHQQQRG